MLVLTGQKDPHSPLNIGPLTDHASPTGEHQGPHPTPPTRPVVTKTPGRPCNMQQGVRQGPGVPPPGSGRRRPSSDALKYHTVAGGPVCRLVS